MKDRVHLADYNWGYIVVDEGHRLKNLDSKLMREIKKYNNASRMILTGTPLHVSCPRLKSFHILIRALKNNLSELWALLNFVLPEIFTNVDDFEEWYGNFYQPMICCAETHVGLIYRRCKRHLVLNGRRKSLMPFTPF